jgi:hypothetical protein
VSGSVSVAIAVRSCGRTLVSPRTSATRAAAARVTLSFDPIAGPMRVATAPALASFTSRAIEAGVSSAIPLTARRASKQKIVFVMSAQSIKNADVHRADEHLCERERYFVAEVREPLEVLIAFDERVLSSVRRYQ